MDSSKENAFNSANGTSNATQSLDVFQTLLLAVEAADGINAQILKSLYFLLVHLSSDIGIGQSGINVTFNDICRLTDVLFKELSKRFEVFLSSLHHVSASAVLEKESLPLDLCADAEKLNLLLRCCMVILNLLDPLQNLLLENGKVLLSILKRLCSLSLAGAKDGKEIGFEKSISHHCIYNESNSTTLLSEDFVASLCFLTPSDPGLPLVSAMLEVFVDELLLSGKLRAFFKLVDSISSSSKFLFIHSSSHGDIEIVIELISTHFFLLLSHEHALQSFLKTLVLIDRKDFRVPDICLTASVSLLLKHVTPSMPKFLQAHLISLVSDAIIVGMRVENLRPDFRLLNCYLSAFERSVILYTKHMSHLQMDKPPTGNRAFCKSGCSVEDFQKSFESHILPETKKKINDLIMSFDSSWNLSLCNWLSRTKSDLVTSSITYIRENESLLDMSCRDESISFLSCILLRASNENHTTLDTSRITGLPDLCLLASILKLMGSSLLQAVWCLRNSGDVHNLRNSGDVDNLRNSGDVDNLMILKKFSLHKVYDSIVGSISCFKEFDLWLPMQIFLYDMMETHQTHKESKVMLLHFLGLLSLGFASGLDFVVKGCILAIMSILNLFVFEEGNLDVLTLLTDPISGSFSTGFAPVNFQEAVVVRKSSIVAASNFQKKRSLRLTCGPLGIGCTGKEDGRATTFSIEENRQETCNGEVYLNCVLGSERPADFDDLADFIECKPGKDYPSWLKDCARFRKWKYEKKAVLRWRKRRQMLQLNKVKRV